MDQSRIDDLTRFVARRIGRRSFGAATLGGLLASLVSGLNPTIAAKKKPKPPACKKPKRRCGKTCVNVKSSRRHCGKCNRACKPGHACRGGKCTPPCGKGGPCRVFVTRSASHGDMNGLAGADAICARSAREGGLPGTYKAWLSDQFGSPATRFVKNKGPYVLVNGTQIANNWTDLIDGALHNPISVTEHAVQLEQVEVWTGTLASGILATYTCNNWTSAARESFGHTGVSSQSLLGRWTLASSPPCDFPLHLYCFQQS